MKVLTLTQPWATLVAIGAKRVETRSWAPPAHFTGPLAIHAGAGLAPVGGRRGLAAILAIEPFRSTLDARNLPYGQILAIAERVTCYPTEVVRGELSPTELAFGDYSDGRFAWFLHDVRRLVAPVPARGSLGLWSFDLPAGALVPV